MLTALAPLKYERYIEPFAGSACFFFARPHTAAVLNDFNSHLMHTYEMVRKHPRLVARRIHLLSEDKRTYYAVRRLNPSTLDPLDRAVRFIYLNRYCYNGVYRTNRKNQFNVPRGRDTGSVPSERHFCRCAFALRRVELRARDFSEALVDIAAGDFVYLDPPYATSRANHGEYGYGAFSETDEARLLEVLRSIDDVGASFLFSYGANSELVKHLDDWVVRVVDVRRQVAGDNTVRGLASEVLVTNYATYE